MKHFIALVNLLFVHLACAQIDVHQEKFRALEPDLWLEIWDKDHSDQQFAITAMGYDEIPKHLEFRGTVVEALKWHDALGENILIQTVTGHFNWKDYGEDSTDFVWLDKSELYVYLFRKNKGEQSFERIWKIYDYTECFGVDWYTGFIPQATTITDVDGNGISEVSIPYVSICRGGVDPGTMKIILYEDQTKYALRGSTMVMCESDEPYGGAYTPSENLVAHKKFSAFLATRWELNKCEQGRYY